VLIGLNVGIFLFWAGGGGLTAEKENQFTFDNAAIPCELTTGHPLTFKELRSQHCDSNPAPGQLPISPDKNVYVAAIVSMFLHAGWLHLLGNMLFLWIFGNNIEDKLGWLAYLGFYLAGGIVATLTQVFADPNSVVPLVGASGAIAAVMGAYLVWFPRTPILTLVLFVLVEVPAGIWLAIWFALQFFTGPSSGVAYMAHIGGFVFGMVVGLFLRNTLWWKRKAVNAYGIPT
jgi:membrane associated rhomboid family serine protease